MRAHSGVETDRGRDPPQNAELQQRIVEMGDDLAAVRTSLRRVIREQN
jgi:hypothetical protein